MAAPSEFGGYRLGHYRILGEIGSGAMGQVLKAHDERLDRDVAIKIISPGALLDENARKRFRNEALALARLNHPNIATIYNFDTQGETDFLVMEYVVGETLAHKLESGSLSEKHLIEIGEQIAGALACAHQSHMVHRDLKPANIMISPSGQVKLLDFGLSLLLHATPELAQADTITSVHSVWGTLPYMAPEQLRGDSVDSRCDIYAIGVVLYEMATGRRPFEAKSSPKLIDDILRNPPAPPQSVNARITPGLANLILKCLEKDREDRYQSANEIAVDLRRLATQELVASTGTMFAFRRRRRALPILLITCALLLLMSVFAVKKWASFIGSASNASNNAPHINSIAVLPLDNLSNEPAQEYFTDGMTEELIYALAKIGELRVVSRTSVMQYKGAHKSVPQIARELHVDAIVSGSVLRVADSKRVRITAELVDAGTDHNLWSQSYERDLTDIFALQDEVARNIAQQIQIQLSPEDESRLANASAVKSEAHEAYLQGRYHWTKGSEQEYREAKRYFERAAEIDAKYAAAYAGLADYYWASDQLPPRDAAPKAREYAQKAVALDSMSADAHTTLGAIHFLADYDWPAAEKEFQRSTSLNPSDADAHQMYSVFLSEQGRTDEAIAQIRTCQQLNPLDSAPRITAGWLFYFARQYDPAIEQCDKALELDTNSLAAHDCLGSAYLAKRDYQKAVAEYRLATAGSGNDPVRLVGLARAYALSGKKRDAQRILESISSAAKDHYVPPYFFAQIYAALGQKDQALSSLEKAYEVGDFYLSHLKVDETLDPLRPDPRFANLLQRMKL
jgi:serine/threonine protein kinase/Flp pilus assembly protein TadD